jgi:hypothetical protein
MQENVTRGRAAWPVGESLAYLFAAATVVLRLFPVIFNFAPVGALSLFAGSRMRSWRAYALPVAVMAASDIGLNLMKGDAPFDPFVYGAFLLTVLLGRLRLRQLSPLRVGVMALLSSLLFFAITNFGCWLSMTGTYPRSFAGLVDCYYKAIPFYRPTLAGDLAFSALFFGLYALAVALRRAPAPKEAA